MTPEERAAAYDLAERLVADHPDCTIRVSVSQDVGWARRPEVSLHRPLGDRSLAAAEAIVAGLYGAVTGRTTGEASGFVTATVPWRGVDIEVDVFHAPEPDDAEEAGR